MYALLGAATDIDEKYHKARVSINNLKQQISKALPEQNKCVLHAETQSRNKDHRGGHNNSSSGVYTLDTKAAFRLRRRLTGHFGKIYALHWADESQNLVSASQDGKLLVWNVVSGNKKIAIPLRSAWVMTCAYSPGRQLVASGGLDNLCSVFNVKDSVGWEVKQPYRELQQHEGYLSCCRFIDNNQILTSSGDASCILWDIEKQNPIMTFNEHNGDVESVAINKDKNTFVSGSIDATAKTWDFRAGNSATGTFVGHQTDINSVAWFPDGNAFASGSDDSTVRLFDLRAHCQLNCYGGNEIYSTVTSVDFSSSGYYLMAGYDEEPYCLAWNTMTGHKESMLEHPTRASCLVTAPDGCSVATGCWDKTLRIWA